MTIRSAQSPRHFPLVGRMIRSPIRSHHNPLPVSPYPTVPPVPGVDPLQTAMDLGLFAEYSYYLMAPSTKDFLIDTLAENGGTASAFGEAMRWRENREWA